MPLTPLQKDLVAILAGNRSEESHFAGGVVLNAAEASARFSHDFDIFHELAEEVTRASNRDVESLRRADFHVDTPSPCGEWEKETTFRKARVTRGGETVEIDWAADSAFRFFPIERDPQLGWRLHLFDVAFVDAAGRPGWIGDDPSLRPHGPSVRGCWPVVRGLEP